MPVEMNVDDEALNAMPRWSEARAVSRRMAGARFLLPLTLESVLRPCRLLIWQCAPGWRSCEP